MLVKRGVLRDRKPPRLREPRGCAKQRKQPLAGEPRGSIAVY